MKLFLYEILKRWYYLLCCSERRHSSNGHDVFHEVWGNSVGNARVSFSIFSLGEVGGEGNPGFTYN